MIEKEKIPVPEKHRTCLVCGNTEHVLWAKDGLFRIVQCSQCGFVWVNPYFSPDQLAAMYQGYIEERLQDNSFKERSQQYIIDRNFLMQFVKRGTVLDVGCSGGFFLDALGQTFERYGLDLDATSIAYAKKHFPFGEHIIQGTLNEAPFPAALFDVITVRGVIQYIQDLDTAMNNLNRMLKPGGYLYICATPNIEAFAADLYREKWSLLNPLEHLFQFSPKTLTRFLTAHGYHHVATDFPYLETPYAHPEQDHVRVLEAVRLVREGKRDQLEASPPFWGNIMNALYQKNAE